MVSKASSSGPAIPSGVREEDSPSPSVEGVKVPFFSASNQHAASSWSFPSAEAYGRKEDVAGAASDEPGNGKLESRAIVIAIRNSDSFYRFGLILDQIV